jgi:hypothetical protein
MGTCSTHSKVASGGIIMEELRQRLLSQKRVEPAHRSPQTRIFEAMVDAMVGTG